MKVLILSSRALIILKYSSCSLTVVIFKSQACVYLTWSLQRSPVIQDLSGPLVAHSSRSFDRCLLHWRPPCSTLGRFLGRLYSTYSLALPWCFSGPVMFFLFSAGGYRQISTVIQFQAHPSGFLHWARGPCSRAAGGSLLTGAVLKARSAGGVSGSFGRSMLKPKLLAGWLSFVPSPTFLHNFQVTPKFPNFQNTAAPYRCRLSLQKSSIRSSTSVMENL